MKKYKKIYIEITNICNLNCDFCPKTQRPQSFMSQELFERILIQIKGRAKFVYFHVMGEPLLHPDFPLFLDLCEKHGFRVNITTNGTLIDKVTGDIFSKPALRQLNFSLHSFDANESLYSMDTYLDNIFAFIHKSLIASKLQICLRLWNLSQVGNNSDNKHILSRLQKEFNIDFTIEDKLTPCNGINLVENVFLNQASKFDWPNISNEIVGNRGFCHGLRDQIAFLVDGTVVPCCLDGEGVISLGNIKDNDLENIIQSKRAKEMYDGFSEKVVVEELCKKCNFRVRFNYKRMQRD
jgi:radical SAM protein with 4Fe4S-binding SPASM domain